MDFTSILIKSSIATGAMAGFQIGLRGLPINKNLLIILGITAGANVIAEAVGSLIFSGQSHQTKNMILEPLMATALMFGGLTVAGFTDLRDMKQAVMSLAIGFGLNLGSDMIGEYLTKK